MLSFSALEIVMSASRLFLLLQELPRRRSLTVELVSSLLYGDLVLAVEAGEFGYEEVRMGFLA